MSDYQRTFYDRHYDRRGRILEAQIGHPAFADFHRRLAAAILDGAPPRSEPLRIVEEACGEGLLAAAVTAEASAGRLPIEYVGADVSASAVGLAAVAEPAARYDVGDASLHLASLPAGSADLVIAKNLLHHLDAPETVLAEARRALSPGGRVVVVEPTRGSLQAWVFNVLAPRRERHWFGRGASDLRQRASVAGLRVAEVRRFSFLPYELLFAIRFDVFRRAFASARVAAPAGRADDRLARLVPALANYWIWVLEAEEATATHS